MANRTNKKRRTRKRYTKYRVKRGGGDSQNESIFNTTANPSVKPPGKSANPSVKPPGKSVKPQDIRSVNPDKPPKHKNDVHLDNQTPTVNFTVNPVNTPTVNPNTTVPPPKPPKPIKVDPLTVNNVTKKSTRNIKSLIRNFLVGKKDNTDVTHENQGNTHETPNNTDAPQDDRFKLKYNKMKSFTKKNLTNMKNYIANQYQDNVKPKIDNMKNHIANQYQNNVKQNIDDLKVGIANQYQNNVKPNIDILQNITKKHVDKIKNYVEHKIEANNLQFSCNKSGVCLAFGKQTEKINAFFDNFTNFKYVTGVPKIFSEGNSNNVAELEYLKNGYKAHAVFKMSKSEKSDNLAYEYLVGKAVNKLMKKFPCFIETYGLYINDCKINFKGWKDSLILLNEEKEDFYKKSCENSSNLALLIQHLSDAKTLEESLKERKSFLERNYFFSDLLIILYQIYMPLSHLKENFTHYDLHSKNVILYEPQENSYIEYHYHFGDNKETIFKSPYLVKIIDYGRSFFKNTDDNSSIIYDKVCINKLCKENCGEEYGYKYYLDPKLKKHYINPKESNPSADLRLLHLCKKSLPNAFIFPELDKLFNDVVYQTDYGTPYHISVVNDEKIYNVTDAFNRLDKLVNEKEKENVEYNTLRFSEMKKLGELHVFADGSDKDIEFK